MTKTNRRSRGLTLLPLILIILGFCAAGFGLYLVRSSIQFRNNLVGLGSESEAEADRCRAELLKDSPSAVEKLLPMAQDEEAPAGKRLFALRALGNLADPAGGKEMIGALSKQVRSGRSDSPMTQGALDALLALARRAPADAKAFRQDICAALLNAAGALAEKGKTDRVEALLAAARTLPCPAGRMPDAIGLLQKRLSDPSPGSRAAAVETAAAFLRALPAQAGDDARPALEKGIALLAQASQDGNARVRAEVRRALDGWNAPAKPQGMVWLLSGAEAQGSGEEAFWIRYFCRMELARAAAAEPPLDPYDAAGPSAGALDGWWQTYSSQTPPSR